MPTIKHTDGPGRYSHSALDHVSGHGDTHEVSDSAVDYLCDEVGHFTRVDEPEDDTVGQEDGPPDADDWEEWSEDTWLDLDYQQRADDVREGRVDEHLEAIGDVETSDTVIEAVDARRDELGE
jgi:hypothetical protein